MFSKQYSIRQYTTNLIGIMAFFGFWAKFLWLSGLRKNLQDCFNFLNAKSVGAKLAKILGTKNHETYRA